MEEGRRKREDSPSHPSGGGSDDMPLERRLSIRRHNNTLPLN